MAAKVRRFRCKTWDDVRDALRSVPRLLKLQPGEELWFRGVTSASLPLLPSLFWRAKGLSRPNLDQLEHNLFFEFQARARELHERNLSDWDYLFFMRHHGVPTRILDWTDSFGVAAYFAVDGLNDNASTIPCVWILNPYELNDRTWVVRDLVLPKYLGQVDDDDDPWDYGDLLLAEGDWLHDGPVAIYPQQISERMRAQRGWFCMFGNSRRPLEVQFPDTLAQLEFEQAVLPDVREFLNMSGLRPYTIYPDLDRLGVEVFKGNETWMESVARDKKQNGGRRAGRSGRASRSAK